MSTPVEFARVDDYAGNGGTVATDPFLRGTVSDPVRAEDRGMELTVAECTTISAPCLMG
jgi:hypothetical protein